MVSFMNRTKRKLFTTAIKLFAEKGYENTGIEEICDSIKGINNEFGR